jgi:hypothetical protein
MIAATLLLGLLSYTLWRFGLKRATSREQVKRLAPAFVTFGLLLILTGLFSLNEWFFAREPRLLTPQTTLPTEIAERMVLMGNISGNTRYSQEITIALEDGELAFTNTDYLGTNWRKTNNSEYLNSGDPIVIVTGIKHDVVHLEFVYRGEYEDFLSFYQRFMLIPLTTMIISFMMAILVIFVSVPYYRRLE